MKFGELRSIAHNIGHSLSSGICLMIGHYEIHVYACAETSPEGNLTVDLLNGLVVEGVASTAVSEAVVLYKEALDGLCRRHGAYTDGFEALRVRFGVDRVYGQHFTVDIQSRAGRSASDLYSGFSGRRVRRKL